MFVKHTICRFAIFIAQFPIPIYIESLSPCRSSGDVLTRVCGDVLTSVSGDVLTGGRFDRTPDTRVNRIQLRSHSKYGYAVTGD